MEASEDVTEKGFGGTAKTLSEKIAHWISVITSPIFLPFPLFLVVALHTAPDVQKGFLWWGIIVVGFTLAPALFIRDGVRKGRYTDTHVSKRSQRLIPLLFGLVCMTIVILCLFLLAASPALLATVIAALICVAIATAITEMLRFKISLHMIGSAGAVTTCVLLFGPLLLFLVPLVILIGWARWHVRAHTVLQACAGTCLAIPITVLIFWLFRV
ncbi:hypothetical protein KSF_109480 [Reticulibacter mediterranei]|uniref:PAP2 superfamily protein n=1 Tax=Reticulibacter mediterranei TaxID=2778369 RepID=A0A8J3N9S1_9CHLR|nr:hypothetical protein [Reticulibacter mediterranei]GHP00901.1 hypothetical protein KSF_109480 [Reticulibacter mediterranei]